MPHVLDKARVWPIIGYSPHKAQQKVHRHRARNKVVSAGRRTGKSQIGGHELTPEALLTATLQNELREAGKRREFWIVGPEYSDSEKEFRVVYNDLKKLDVPFDRPGTYNNPETGDMHISLWDGTFKINAMSAKYPQTLVGEGLSGVILAEAAKLKPTVWTKYIRPTLADFHGWALLSSTPEGKNWYYDMWRRGQDPSDTTWASWRFPSWANNILFPGGRTDPEILDMAKDMTPEKFKQEIEADFTEFVGRVFKGFDEEVHVTDLAYDPKLPLYLAIDYGWTNPTVVLLIQVDVFDNVYVIGEYRVRQKDIEQIGLDLVDWRMGLARRAIGIYGDPASPADSAFLSRKLSVPSKGGTGGDINDRLNLIRKWLRVGPEHAPEKDQKPKLFIDRSCINLIYEMSEYRYPDLKSETSPEPELPLKKDDHGPEALGRFFRGYFGTPQSGSNRAVVRKAKVG